MAYKDKNVAAKKQNEWQSKNFDRINLTVPKGQKEIIRAHAEARGQSTIGFIRQAIQNEIDRTAEGTE